ncbi:MAG TPA: 4Fe-4S single cluster domain-containing protein [Myxococcota bacterium]
MHDDADTDIDAGAATVNVALEVACTEAEGPGRRYALWVQGCPLRCKGCCNPEFLVDTPRTHRHVREIVADMRRARDERGIEGISLLGGEPTRQAVALADVAVAARELGLSVMVFSGFTKAQLVAEDAPGVARLLAHTDLLVDGPYIEAQRTTSRRYIGSDNQVLHHLTDRYRIDDPRFAAPNTVELRIVVDVDGAQRFELNGWPVRGASTR